MGSSLAKSGYSLGTCPKQGNAERRRPADTGGTLRASRSEVVPSRSGLVGNATGHVRHSSVSSVVQSFCGVQSPPMVYLAPPGAAPRPFPLFNSGPADGHTCARRFLRPSASPAPAGASARCASLVPPRPEASAPSFFRSMSAVGMAATGRVRRRRRRAGRSSMVRISDRRSSRAVRTDYLRGLANHATRFGGSIRNERRS